MAYRQDVKTAAHRYLKSGVVLHEETGAGLQPGCGAVAGYLFGIAGELAVKRMMQDSGMKPDANDHKGDPFYAHFPHLKTMLSSAVGRRSGELRKISEDQKLFENWDIAMRYAPVTDVDPKRVVAWRKSAESLVDRMEAD